MKQWTVFLKKKHAQSDKSILKNKMEYFSAFKLQGRRFRRWALIGGATRRPGHQRRLAGLESRVVVLNAALESQTWQGVRLLRVLSCGVMALCSFFPAAKKQSPGYIDNKRTTHLNNCSQSVKSLP